MSVLKNRKIITHFEAIPTLIGLKINIKFPSPKVGEGLRVRYRV